jgi:hypothetical protein
MKKYFLILVVFLSLIFSQSNQPYPPNNLVTIPTAGTLPKGYFSFENTFMNSGSILPKFSVGITDNFTLGMSFGISNFIGNGSMQKNKAYPEVQVKYRVYDETDVIPAIVVGIDTQGKGNFFAKHNSLSLNRYEQKSFGFYIVMSRNWSALGNFGFHFGLNKNLTESDDKDDDINMFFGFDKELNKSFLIYGEYNFARDDDRYNDGMQEIIYRKGNGYLNAGLRWSATNNLMLEINVNDLSKNDRNSNAFNRELKIIYFEQF